MYSIALIGCGRISFKHIEGYVHNSDSLRFVTACDPVVERAEAKRNEYFKSFPNADIKIYADYREMLSELKPDIVTIATESGKHCEIAVACLEAGCHVICEKPMALSTADADKMISVAKKKQPQACSLFSKPI